MVWILIDGKYPENCSPEHKLFEWRPDQRLSTIYVQHPKGIMYDMTRDSQLLKMAFDEIVWPPDWELPWLAAEVETDDDDLRRVYVQSFYKSKYKVIMSFGN